MIQMFRLLTEAFITDDSHTQALLYKYRVDDRWWQVMWGWGEADSTNIHNHPIHLQVVPVQQSAQPPGHQGHLSSISDTQAGAGPPQGPCSITAEKGSALHLWPVPSVLHQPDWTVPGAAPWGASQSTEEGGCAGLSGCWTCVYIRPSDGIVQGQGYGLSPSHPDPVSIGVLAHQTRAGPPQQREGHTARTLHHSAEVITQPTGIDFPFCDYLTIIISFTYYFCTALYLII